MQIRGEVMMHLMKTYVGRATALGLLLLIAACNPHLDTVKPVTVVVSPPILEAKQVSLPRKEVEPSKALKDEPVVTPTPETISKPI